MDNVTHTLAGLVVAELAVAAVTRRAGAPPRPELRDALWLTSAIANNLPDADFAITELTGGKLGYLLHHRGHTHTLGLAPLMAGAALGLALARHRKARFGRAELALLGAIALVGTALHVSMDALNDYGVHPLWPFSSAWLHGDTLFIIEPLLWAALAAPLLPVVRTQLARIALTLVLVVGVALPTALRVVPPPAIALTAALGVGLALISVRLAPSARPLLALASAALVVGSFGVGRAMAARAAMTDIAERFEHAELVHVALGPSPGDPRCFRGLATMHERGRYRVARFVVVADPAWGGPHTCAMPIARDLTASLSAIDAANESIAWLDAYEIDRASLDALSVTCHGDAFLRFARVPFAMVDGDTTTWGDLRYDREAGLGFAEIEVERDAPCPRFVPPWDHASPAFRAHGGDRAPE